MPIDPPPRTTACSGSSCNCHSVLEVKKSICSIFSIRGTKGSEPVAIIIFLVVRTLPFTWTSQGERTSPSPSSTSTPNSRYRSGESWGSMVLMIRCTRAMSALKLTFGSTSLKPNWLPCRRSNACRADRIRALLGTQPVFRQSPPILFFSINVTLALTVAAISAATKPPDPAPMTTRSRSNFLGRSKPLYTRWALSQPTIHLVNNGNRPSNTNEESNPIEKTSLGLLIREISVPALTYNMVPASIPTWDTK